MTIPVLISLIDVVVANNYKNDWKRKLSLAYLTCNMQKNIKLPSICFLECQIQTDSPGQFWMNLMSHTQGSQLMRHLIHIFAQWSKLKLSKLLRLCRPWGEVHGYARKTYKMVIMTHPSTNQTYPNSVSFLMDRCIFLHGYSWVFRPPVNFSLILGIFPPETSSLMSQKYIILAQPQSQ